MSTGKSDSHEEASGEAGGAPAGLRGAEERDPLEECERHGVGGSEYQPASGARRPAPGAAGNIPPPLKDLSRFLSYFSRRPATYAAGFGTMALSAALFLAMPRIVRVTGATVTALELPRGGTGAKIVWKHAVDGTPGTMLAADGRLFVVTREGTLWNGNRFKALVQNPAAGRRVFPIVLGSGEPSFELNKATT